MTILVTGGAGYIGSHTVLCLLDNNYNVVVLDNFINSSEQSLKRVSLLANRDVKIYNGDIRNRILLNNIFSEQNITHVIHFAGLKSVSESVNEPINYYDNNLNGSLILVDMMLKYKIYNLVFSSSATVYGTPTSVPVNEKSHVGGTTNPYGTSKLMIEKVLGDIATVEPKFRVTTLRYFNPVGAHCSGLIGEDPNGVPNNLMPYICQVAIGKQKQLLIYGNDFFFQAEDGIRDFVHVMDLAEGHLAALRHSDEGPNYKVYNLGTGIGYSVLEILETFQRITSKYVPRVFVDRRHGDIAECWSDPSRANKELCWKAKRGLEEMVRDAWNWQQRNPNGYTKSNNN
ncbi:UDP-glucose 4-epimerase GalE [Salmonella enterica]|nr:UDP-glucose 4-epimerase GalE [Salmonella enterica]EGV3961621.1 UDP-glucose 4-epimerase GalE [Salmonella enterica]